MLLSTNEMMAETKRTGKIAIVVEVPERLEPYKQNWIGSGVFYDERFDRYCVNKWFSNYGYPHMTPDELLNCEVRKDIKWSIDENAQKAKPKDI